MHAALGPLLQTAIDGLLLGGVYGLIAVGLTLIWGMMDVVNFAHGEFVMIGMYVAYVVVVLTHTDVVAFTVASALVLFALGVVIYYGLIRYLLRGPMIAQILGTFGLSLALQYAIFWIFSPNYLTLPGNALGGSLAFGGVHVPVAKLAAGLFSVVMSGALFVLLTRTRVGKQMLAVSENRDASMLMGIQPDRVHALAWGISAGSAGIAGALLATFFYIFPGVGTTFVLLAFVVVCLGGFGSVPGAIVGGLVVGLIQSFVGYLGGSSYKNMAVFGIFLAVLWLRPQGLFGKARA